MPIPEFLEDTEAEPTSNLPDVIENQQLSAKQRKFVLAFVRNGGDKASAAEEAGYAQSVTRNEAVLNQLLKNAKVAQAILDMEREAAVAAAYSIERAICEELARVQVDVGEAYDDFGDLLPLKHWPAHLRCMVKAFDVTERSAPDGTKITTTKVTLMDKDRAMDRLQKMLGFQREKVEVSGNVQHEHAHKLVNLVESLQGTALRPAIVDAHLAEDALYIEESNNG